MISINLVAVYIQVKLCAAIHRTCGQLYCYDTRHKLDAVPSPCPMEIRYFVLLFSSLKYWKLQKEKNQYPFTSLMLRIQNKFYINSENLV